MRSTKQSSSKKKLEVVLDNQRVTSIAEEEVETDEEAAHEEDATWLDFYDEN